jgi:hypothetical protein
MEDETVAPKYKIMENELHFFRVLKLTSSQGYKPRYIHIFNEKDEQKDFDNIEEAHEFIRQDKTNDENRKKRNAWKEVENTD